PIGRWKGGVERHRKAAPYVVAPEIQDGRENSHSRNREPRDAIGQRPAFWRRSRERLAPVIEKLHAAEERLVEFGGPGLVGVGKVIVAVGRQFAVPTDDRIGVELGSFGLEQRRPFHRRAILLLARAPAARERRAGWVAAHFRIVLR